jgi:radical SAM protein with 4Fe4S-binding SPASM domain
VPVAATVYLAPDVSLKRLETPCAYDRAADDLFELTDDAFAFLERALGGAPAADADPEFLAACLAEGILIEHDPGRRSDGRAAEAARPSLRYLLVHLTRRCNLACRHCYLGEAEAADLPVDQARPLIEEFAGGGGLRLLLSGGEPLMHPRFWEIDALLADVDVRAVLLTNGTLIDREVAERLHVHEVQVSLDGMEAAHDRLRGGGAFAAALAGLRAARAAGLQVSVATTVNRYNRRDFDELAALVRDLDAWQWNIDVPALSGRLGERPELLAPLAEAVRVQDHAFSSGSHGGDEGQLCGAHLAAVMPDGDLVKCGLLTDVRGGPIAGGLQAAWRALPHLPTTVLGDTCRACEALPTCRGGCRFRAGGLRCEAPDLVQCHRFGVV